MSTAKWWATPCFTGERIIPVRTCLLTCFAVAEYLAETETAMTKAETGEFLFDDLRELAASHTQQKLEFEKLVPDSICLGLFVVSCG